MKTTKTQNGIQKEVKVFNSTIIEKIALMRGEIANITLGNTPETEKEVEAMIKLKIANSILFDVLKDLQ